MNEAIIRRLEAAVTRVEAASERAREHAAGMADRHAALRARMAEAVKALDDVIARGDA